MRFLTFFLLPSFLLLSTSGEQCSECSKQVDDLTQMVIELRAELELKLDQQESKLPSMVSQAVRDLPYMMICAYKGEWTTASSTITYDKIITDFNNADKPNGGDGLLDIGSGIFTCLKAGHYTITFSAFTVLDTYQHANVYLYQNGNKVSESQFSSTNNANYPIGSQGSRTMILHMDVDDVMEVKTDSSNDGVLHQINFCVSLTGFDYE